MFVMALDLCTARVATDMGQLTERLDTATFRSKDWTAVISQLGAATQQELDGVRFKAPPTRSARAAQSCSEAHRARGALTALTALTVRWSHGAQAALEVTAMPQSC